MTSGVRVQGTATAEEVAAVLAVLAHCARDEPNPTAYARWRAARQRALREVPATDDRPA